VSSRLPAFFRLTHLAVLTAAVIWLMSTGSRTTSLHVAESIGAAGWCLFVAGFTFSPTARLSLLRWRDRTVPPVARAALAVLPWVALFAIATWRGFWWTQRPEPRRFALTCALVGWSVAWSFGNGPPRTRGAGAVRRALLGVAACLAVASVEGLSFGFDPFGCAASAALGLWAAIASAAATSRGDLAPVRVLLVSAASVVAMGGSELVVRALKLGQNAQAVDNRAIARQFYSLTPPGAAFLNQPKALDEFSPALIQINSRGIRGPEIPDGPADVLIIGDSFVEARQLPWDQTVGPVLQETLRQRGRPLRVVAHGMRGWSPLLEWNWYLKVGRRFQPRLVFLFFFWNDLWPSGTEAASFHAVMTADGRPDHFDVPVDANWIWYKHVRVVRLFEDVWQRVSVNGLKQAFAAMAARRTSASPLDDRRAHELARATGIAALSQADLDRLLHQPEDALDPALRALLDQDMWRGVRPTRLWSQAQLAAAAAAERELALFSQDVASNGGQLVIVYVPNPLQVAARECSVGRVFSRLDETQTLPVDTGLQSWLGQVAARYGLQFLDSTASMRAADHASAAPLLYLRADCHWSAQGHQFMAAYLADWLLAQRLR